MATAAERLQALIQPSPAGKPKVALDTCCVQYYMSNPPVQPWADCLDTIFRAALDGHVDLYISAIVLSELLSHVYFANRHNAGYDPELDLLAIINRHFQVLNVDGDVAKAAGRLRGNYAPGEKIVLKTPDAVIGATSLANSHALFVTNDAQLASALHDGNCLYLRDLALEWLAHHFPSPCRDAQGAVAVSHRGAGLPPGAVATLTRAGGIRPNAAANWRRILKDAQTAATVIGEPCVCFILADRTKGGRSAPTEVIFWRAGQVETKAHARILKHLRVHVAQAATAGSAGGSHAYCIVFASRAQEQQRQEHPGFASKTADQKAVDAWNAYLEPWRVFRAGLEVPQTMWHLCEDGTTHRLESTATMAFLDRARNVLGWKDEA